MLHTYFLFFERAVVNAELKEIVSAAVGANGCDFTKPEQKIAIESFLRDHAAFVSLPAGYGKVCVMLAALE